MRHRGFLVRGSSKDLTGSSDSPNVCGCSRRIRVIAALYRQSRGRERRRGVVQVYHAREAGNLDFSI